MVKKKKTKNYNNVGEIIAEIAEALRPPERMTVSEAAEKYRYVNQPGAFVGQWDNTITPYMREPMDTLASRTYDKLAFVGPAQSGKTDALILNGVVYTVKVDPMDALLYCPTSTAARDFSMRRIDRLHQHSKAVGEMLIGRADADNTFDKHYRSGNILTMSYPSVTELAGRPVGRIYMTDYDRIPDDVGGDGSAFHLAYQRTTTFGSFAMCAAESSPSRPVLDPKWIATSPHEAPPCTGILGLYNQGDRRRWQWPCPSCWEWFEGKFELLVWEEKGSNLESARTVRMACPHCGDLIHPDERKEMQQWGIWVPDGMKVSSDGRLVGRRPTSEFASFWLRGTAAAFVSWTKLVNVYLDAMDEYRRTGSEESLKKFRNNDMGEPYIPMSQDTLRTPEVLMARKTPRERGVVPFGVRFLVATVDVQKDRFCVQVTGIMPGEPFDMVPIDRFELRKSLVLDEDGDPDRVRPASRLSDWDLLIDKVMEREYPLEDESGRKMGIKMTGCDSGGEAGVTDKAYSFYRRLMRMGLAQFFILIKGDRYPNKPRTRIEFPDSKKKSNQNGARGDIPMLFINTNVMKDSLAGRLDAVQPGTGMIHIGSWLPNNWFLEMCAEVRTDKGWENPKQLRNEAFDLTNYAASICIERRLLDIERINWQKPPAWAAEWDENTTISTPVVNDEGEKVYVRPTESKIDFAALAKELA